MPSKFAPFKVIFHCCNGHSCDVTCSRRNCYVTCGRNIIYDMKSKSEKYIYVLLFVLFQEGTHYGINSE